jgi:hypothetical protein
MLLQMWRRTDEAIESLSDRLKDLARQSELCRRLQSIQGIGPLVSTALVSAIETRTRFDPHRICRHGLDGYHGNTRPAVNPSYWASPSAATHILGALCSSGSSAVGAEAQTGRTAAQASGRVLAPKLMRFCVPGALSYCLSRYPARPYSSRHEPSNRNFPVDAPRVALPS